MFRRNGFIVAALAAGIANISAANLSIPNASFESPSVGGGLFQYKPNGASWSWAGGAGLSGNGSGFTANNPNSPEGVQVAFLQGNGSFWQPVSGFTAGTTYTLRFLAAQRNYAQSGQTWNVQIEGVVVGTFSPPQSAQAYAEYTATFTTTAGTKELRFQGLNSAGGDNTVFIDHVRIEFTAPPPVGNGTGLRGEYWNNLNHSGAPALTRTDATVDFNWGEDSPGPGVNTSTFTTRWTGKVQPQFSETYTFYTVTDDGARLWVNGVQLVNDWTDHPAEERSGTITLTAGQQYDIVMEQYDGGGGAVARLLWSSPSAPKAVIPQTQLYPPASTPASPSALTATALATNRIRLTWTDNANNENGFAIERKTGAGGTYAQVATVGANVSTFTNTGLAANTSYFYRVRATNAAGASAYSAEATATTLPFPPATPGGLTATTLSASSIRLNWTDNANNETGFKIERKTGSGGTYAQIATVGANVTTFTNTGLSVATTYFYRVRATNSGGDSAFSAEASATTQNGCGALPSPFASQDIGAVGLAGGACYAGAQFTVRASGGDIWETADAFHFVHRSWTGNVEIIARVASLQPTDQWAKFGVMVRESLNANSIHALMVVTPAAGSSFQRRKSTGGASEHTSPADSVTAPHWVRLVRNGTTFTGYRSSDGSNWVQVGTDTITMASTFRVGIALTAHNNGVLNTSVVDNVIVRVPSVSPPAAPSSLAASPASSSQINVSWTDNANNETGFEVQRKTGAGGTYANIGSTGVNVTTFADSGLAAGTIYFYRVRAVNSGGASAYSAETSATTPNVGGGTDYEGRPFVTQAAPVLTFQRKTQPNLTGIDYTFSEQTARGVALLSRFPPFTLSDRRIHVDGPWYEDMAVNLHFSRGIQSVGAIPRYREILDAPYNVRQLEPTNKWQLMTDPLWYQLAINLANQLEAQNPSDPRIGPLRTFGINHLFSDHEGAFRELGRYGYNAERWPTDVDGHSVRYPCLDIETTGNFQFQRNCMGWMYQGMAESAAAIGQSIIPMLYAQWQYSVGAFFESSRQGGTGDPEYLLPDRDFLGGPDPTIQACQDNGGIISMDGYMRALWTRDQPFYKRNPDGSLQLSGGLPVFNDATSGSAYGWNLLLESGEAKHCLDDLYTMAVRMFLQHYRFAGQYPANSSLRKSFLTNAKVGAWQRYSNEGLAGIQQNDRPMPDWILDLLTGLYLFTADDVTVWSSDMNFYPGPIGGNYTNAWRYNAHGVLESVVKAAHRYSANDPLHAAGGTYQWCWFNLPVINQNTTAGDRYFEKPIAIGKLRQFEGHTYLELFVAWPALDNTSKTFKVWVDKNGTRSNAYTIQLPNGRSYFYDAWQLPDSFTGLEGQHIWLRATDMLGQQRTWRGDWRVPADNNVPTPADF